jgi:uncharacterized protein YaiI (UPF0178 family)
MTLFIDGDAFVNSLKPIVTKAINRLKIPTIVVSNKKIIVGKSNYISYEIVSLGADKADDRIIELVKKDDLVITTDIPLADKIISKGAIGIDHRGTLYTKENIKQCLTMRNLMAEIRDSGEITKGAKPFGQKDIYLFANEFDKYLSKTFKV